MTDDCALRLPGFWRDIANILWPGYYKPDVSIARLEVLLWTLVVFCVHWYSVPFFPGISWSSLVLLGLSISR